ncbi:MAG TPA: signal peptidase I [Candidatus Acidoferrales bacterium]|nr:signal peptidase I [Candidatus Acidoferrales bacterium]
MKVERTEKMVKAPLAYRIKREVIAWAWLLLIFLFIQGTLVQARVIPSGSMEATLLVGDHLIMSRFGYDVGVPGLDWHVPLWRQPKRQQLIIFRSVMEPGTDLVKRVIGLPGDTVEIREGVVHVNGAPLAEPYLAAPMRPSEQFGPVQVPPEGYFVMGDNRANSYDSRFWGSVPRRNIVGAPLVIYMSIDAPEAAWQPGQLRERVLAYVSVLTQPRLVRWKRILTTF